MSLNSLDKKIRFGWDELCACSENLHLIRADINKSALGKTWTAFLRFFVLNCFLELRFVSGQIVKFIFVVK